MSLFIMCAMGWNYMFPRIGRTIRDLHSYACHRVFVGVSEREVFPCFAMRRKRKKKKYIDDIDAGRPPRG